MPYITKSILLSIILLITLINYSQAAEKSDPERVLRTGFYLDSFPDLSLEDLKIALRYWTEEIGKQAGIPASVSIYTNINQMRNDFYQGKINLIVASPLVIVNEFDKNQLADGFKVTWPSKLEDNLLVVTHKESTINNFKSVKNKKLTLLKNEPISKLYADVLTLQQFGNISAKVFKNIKYSQKSNQLIYKLFFKNTDVIFVYQVAYELAIELNPQIGAKTQVISTLPSIPRALGFFHGDVDFTFREEVIDVIEKLDTYTRGRHLLSLFDAGKTVRSNISDLITTEQLQHNHKRLIKQTLNRR